MEMTTEEMEGVISKAYLGPPASDPDHMKWYENCTKSDSFCMPHELDGGNMGFIIIFSLKHKVSVSFDKVREYIRERGKTYHKLIENPFAPNPRFGIYVSDEHNR